jgi:predicted nucleotidyltransferase
MLINLRDNVSMPKKQEITANDLIEDKREELARLCAAYHVHRLELFGSATGEKFEPDTSDLDFLVEFEDLSPGEHADAFFGLIEALQSAFGRPVDLLERRAIRNPYLLRAIEQTRMVVYAAA